MSDGTKIEWTDATLNPITGCFMVSPGCTNCYAMKLAGTRLQHHPSRAGLTRRSKGGSVWTGEVRFNEQWLTQPLTWTKPRMIFVCAHGDLFAEGVPDEWIDQVFAVMALAPQHTFQVLTKRPERMRDYLRRPISRIHNAVAILATRDDPNSREEFYRQWPECKIEAFIPAAAARSLRAGWPLPNVWLGVSVEDQKRADERREPMANLSADGWTTWVSYEPALGPVKWSDWDFLRWMVSGGESGADARPSHPDWFRAARDFCVTSGIPFLFKQWGEWWEVWSEMRDENGNHLVVDADSHEASELWDEHFDCLITHDGRRFTPETLPEDTPGRLMSRIGKRAGGRLLDGIEHNAFPVIVR